MDPLKLTCKYCGKTYRARRTRTFCGQPCANKYHGEMRKSNIEKITVTTVIYPGDKHFLNEHNLTYQEALHQGTIMLRSKLRHKRLIHENLGFLYVFFIGLLLIVLTPYTKGLQLQLFLLFLGVFLIVYGLMNSLFYELLEKINDAIMGFIGKDT